MGKKCAIKDCKFGVNLHSFVSHPFLLHSFIASNPKRVKLIINRDSEPFTVFIIGGSTQKGGKESKKRFRD